MKPDELEALLQASLELLADGTPAESVTKAVRQIAGGRQPSVKPSPFRAAKRFDVKSFRAYRVKGGYTGTKKDKRGYNICYQDGRRVSCSRSGGASPKQPAQQQQPVAKKPSPKQQAKQDATAKKKQEYREAADRAKNAARYVAKGPSRATAEQVKIIGDALVSMTLAELKEFKNELNVKGGSTKKDIVERIKKDALTKAGIKPPETEPEPPAKTPPGTPAKRLSKPEDSQTFREWWGGGKKNEPLVRWRGNGTSGSDTMMAELNKEIGYDALPEVVDESEMDRLVAAGGLELYRGVSDASNVEAFKKGDFWAGLGMSGNGTYTAPAKYGDLSYKNGYDLALDFTSITGGEKKSHNVMRMTLKKGAKIASPEEMLDLFRKQREDIAAIAEKARNADTPDEVDDLDRQAAVLADMGKYLTFQGYDAYYSSAEGDGDYFIVLNRGACVVQASPAKPVAGGKKKTAEDFQQTPAPEPSDDDIIDMGDFE